MHLRSILCSSQWMLVEVLSVYDSSKNLIFIVFPLLGPKIEFEFHKPSVTTSVDLICHLARASLASLIQFISKVSLYDWLANNEGVFEVCVCLLHISEWLYRVSDSSCSVCSLSFINSLPWVLLWLARLSSWSFPGNLQYGFRSTWVFWECGCVSVCTLVLVFMLRVNWECMPEWLLDVWQAYGGPIGASTQPMTWLVRRENIFRQLETFSLVSHFEMASSWNSSMKYEYERFNS